MKNQITHKQKRKSAWDSEKNRFFDKIIELKLASNANQIEKFLQDSVQGREYAKFVFTRSLSEAMELIAAYGEINGITRLELANTNLHVIISELIETEEKAQQLKVIPKLIKKISDLGALIELPPLITKESDFNCLVFF